VHDTTLLLGEDHATWGEFTLVDAGAGRSAVAISVGMDPIAPSMQSKGSRMYPNEDGVLLVEQGELLLMAVADAHRGHEASHALLSKLAASGPDVPSSSRELEMRVARLAVPESSQDSGTTLLVAVYDRETGQGFGISFGDSSLMRIDDDGATFLNLRRAQYLVPGSAIDPTEGLAFRFEAGDGALLVAFTDGVDECHYRSPATSIGPRHLEAIFERTGARPRPFAEALMRMALSGVDGHPGGQDNIALVVSSTARVCR
jgi:hypothetical protein